MENIPTGTPFHPGELAAQDRAGVREKVAVFGHRFIRPVLPQQHRDFYPELPFLALGSVDADGRPWASVLSGPPGFASSPDERTLRVAATPPPGDPLAGHLAVGADIGVLGIQPETRRRNRMTGRVKAARPGEFEIDVRQSFGNCPKFIQTRAVRHVSAAPASPVDAHSDGEFDGEFDGPTRALIAGADTFFIATAFRDDDGAVSQGADISHRGGKPGFVKPEGRRGFVFPDFSGNNIFNTVGNLTLNPKAGFLFPDFVTGDLVTMTGAAEIIWDGPEVSAFEGAERLIRFEAEDVRRLPGGLGVRASFGDYSPYLARTGAW